MTYPISLTGLGTYPAGDFRAQSGANEGHPIGLGAIAVPGDTYRLVRGARMARLITTDHATHGLMVAPGSEVGAPGDSMAIVACHTLMDDTGAVVELLILHHDSALAGAMLHLLPLSPLRHGVEYELIGSAPAAPPERLGYMCSDGFFAGTHLTLADGRQAPVEQLRPGDLLLTRERGARPIRSMAHRTCRATGSAAPVLITRGTLNALRDLRLGPDHRLFIWQRPDAPGLGRAELLVRAASLINGVTVLHDEGGYLDIHEIQLDTPAIVFAEGLAVASQRTPTLGRPATGPDPRWHERPRAAVLAETPRPRHVPPATDEQGHGHGPDMAQARPRG